MTAFIKGYGPPCPHCGCIRSKRIGNGWSEPNDDYLRYKKCDECGDNFATVEVVIDPESTSFYRLDYRGRELRRDRWRRRYSKTGRHVIGKLERSDELHVTVKVKRSREFDKDKCRRGHPLSGDNLYINPASGHRRCKKCRKSYQHSYHARKKTVPGRPIAFDDPAHVAARARKAQQRRAA